MFSYRKYKHVTCFAASAAVTAGLLLNTPSVAYADAAADLANARTNLEQIGQKVEDLSGDLETLVTELDNTEYEIMVKEQKIAQNQETLASFVAADYKGGATELLSIILGSTSFDDMVSRIRYVQKISDAQTNAIDEIKSAKEDLEERKAYQQSTLDDTQAKLDELNSQRSSAASLVESLDAEVKAQLEKEAAQNSTLNVALEQSKVQQTTTSASDIDAVRDAADSIKQESTSNKTDNSGGNNAGNSSGSSTDDPSTNNTQRPDTPTGGNTDYSSRSRDASLYNVTWTGDSGYINRLAQKASQVGSGSNYFIAWDNELCRFIVFQRSGGGWSAIKLWNCNGARATYSGAWSVVHRQKCNWADEYFGMGYNDWSTCFIESYSSSSKGHLRYIPGKGYEDCASIHATGYSETGWGNGGCCGLLIDDAKWVYDNIPNGTTVYEFRYSDGRVF